MAKTSKTFYCQTGYFHRLLKPISDDEKKFPSLNLRIPINMNSSLINFIQYYDGNIFAHASGHKSGINEKMLFKIDEKTGKILAEYLDSWEHNCGWNERMNFGHSFFFPVSDGVPKFAAALMNSLFSLDNILPAITVKSKRVSTKEDLKLFTVDNFHSVNFKKFPIFAITLNTVNLYTLIPLLTDLLFLSFTIAATKHPIFFHFSAMTLFIRNLISFQYLYIQIQRRI